MFLNEGPSVSFPPQLLWVLSMVVVGTHFTFLHIVV